MIASITGDKDEQGGNGVWVRWWFISFFSYVNVLLVRVLWHDCFLLHLSDYGMSEIEQEGIGSFL